MQIPHEIDEKFDAQLTELVSNLTNPDPKFHYLRCGADDNYYTNDDYTLLKSSSKLRVINYLYGS
jgi:hypothetical protein